MECSDMQRRSLVKESSGPSFEFGTSSRRVSILGLQAMVDSDTELIDINAFADKDDEDVEWLFPTEDHPPEDYLQQLEIFNEQE